MPTPSLLIVPARFKTGTLYSQIPVPVAPSTSSVGDFTVTRNTAARRFGPDGLIASVASGIPRLDYYTSGGVTGCPALLVEPAATNLALHSRDLSNAVWSGTNITTAKNAVGADGVASGATTLTATAASGTVLQAISHASQSRVFSAYVRRVSGTGAIQMTTNGGTSWTTVTISSLYTQVACAAQTVASGTVGFRMAVSGDVIEVDFTQGEVGPVATSPIPTTAGTGSRSADVISVTGAVSGSIGQTAGTAYLEIVAVSGTNSGRVLSLTESSAPTNNRIAFSIDSTNHRLEIIVRSNGSITSGSIGSSAATLLVNGVNKIAYAYDGVAGSNALAINGSVVATNSQTFAFTQALSRVNVAISESDLTVALNQRIRAAAIYTTRLTNAELASLTTP